MDAHAKSPANTMIIKTMTQIREEEVDLLQEAYARRNAGANVKYPATMIVKTIVKVVAVVEAEAVAAVGVIAIVAVVATAGVEVGLHLLNLYNKLLLRILLLPLLQRNHRHHLAPPHPHHPVAHPRLIVRQNHLFQALQFQQSLQDLQFHLPLAIRRLHHILHLLSYPVVRHPLVLRLVRRHPVPHRLVPRHPVRRLAPRLQVLRRLAHLINFPTGCPLLHHLHHIRCLHHHRPRRHRSVVLQNAKLQQHPYWNA